MINNTARILQALELEYYLPRYFSIDIFPLIMEPKVLAISSLPCERRAEDNMLKGMLDVLELPPNSISVAKRKNIVVKDRKFLSEIMELVQDILPNKILYFGDPDKSIPSGWDFIVHPRYLLDNQLLKKKIYMQLLDLKKEL